MNKIFFDGVGFDAISFDELVTRTICAISKNTKLVILSVNLNSIALANLNDGYKSVLKTHEYTVLCDGIGVVVLSRFFNSASIPKLSVNDWIGDFFSGLHGKLKIFILGSNSESLHSFKAQYYANNNRDDIVGMNEGFFELNSQEELKIINKINSSGANILLVGMGNPRQEKWIHDNFNKLNINVFIGLGSTIEYYGKVKKRSPKFLIKIGLEWFYRLLSEPNQVWERYLIIIPKYILKLFYQSIRRKYEKN